MKEVLLVSPPFYRLMGSHYNGDNLGLAYLSAFVERAGFQCDIVNCDLLPGKKYCDQVELYKGYEEYKRIMVDPNHAIWKECVERILYYDPR